MDVLVDPMCINVLSMSYVRVIAKKLKAMFYRPSRTIPAAKASLKTSTSEQYWDIIMDYWVIMHLWYFRDIPIEQASIDDTLLLWLQIQLFGQHRHDGWDLFLVVHVPERCVWLEIVGDLAIDFGEQRQDVVILDIGLEDLTQRLDEPGLIAWMARGEITWNMQTVIAYTFTKYYNIISKYWHRLSF